MSTRSDVYSAAAVLFLLLSGRLPHPPGDRGHSAVPEGARFLGLPLAAVAAHTAADPDVHG